MKFHDSTLPDESAPLSDAALRAIAEQGFFGRPGCLADARSACSELIFARALIEAQTTRIEAQTTRIAQLKQLALAT
jgi:hypothetical protein